MFRFAYLPTRELTVEELRIALFNFILSQQKNDKLHIRIEDIKQDITNHIEENLEFLALFKISWSEVSYQSHSIKFHQQLATKLLMDKNAYSCFCDGDRCFNDCESLSDEEVLNSQKPFCIRVKQPKDEIVFDDKIIGEIKTKGSDIANFMILEVDKTPTYNFATSLDDMLLDIDTVVCKDKDISNTPKQILLRDYLGYDKSINYAHLPELICKDDKTSSVKWLLEEGFLPSAITNYLIKLANKTPIDIFTLDDAKEWFSLKNLSSSKVNFDLLKLKEINKKHIKNLPPKELAKFLSYSSSDLGELAKIYTQECSTINEIKSKLDAIFAKKEPSEFLSEFGRIREIAQNAPFFKEYKEFEEYLLKESGYDIETLLKPLRFLLTGMQDGPKLDDIYPHIKNYLGEITRC